MPYYHFDLMGLLIKKDKFKFSSSDIQCILRSVTQQLGDLHSRGLVHRDIKSSNVFLNRNGSAALGDFGHTLTEQQSVGNFRCGTKPFMAPEMIEGRLRQEKGLEIATVCSQASDIWSLGCVLAHMIMGIAIFRPSSKQADILSIFFCLFPNDPALKGLKQFSNLQSIANFKKCNLKSLIERFNPSVDESMKDLLCLMLSPDANSRPSCEDILNHKALRFDRISAEELLMSKLKGLGDTHEHQVKQRRYRNKQRSCTSSKGNLKSKKYIKRIRP